eukprot:4959184-Pleurochrysis_carterae.AAC.1
MPVRVRPSVLVGDRARAGKSEKANMEVCVLSPSAVFICSERLKRRVVSPHACSPICRDRLLSHTYALALGLAHPLHPVLER